MYGFQSRFVAQNKAACHSHSSRVWINWFNGVLRLKVKCTLVQALRLCTGRTAHRGSRGITLPFHDHGTRRVWGISVTPRSFFTPGKVPVLIAQEAGWAPGTVWTGAENLDLTGIRSPDGPARSQSLYWLSYPAHSPEVRLNKFLNRTEFQTLSPEWTITLNDGVNTWVSFNKYGFTNGLMIRNNKPKWREFKKFSLIYSLP